MTHELTESSGRTAGTIGLVHGIALYLCAILGAGALVLPGQAASLAGPGSLLAWAFSAALGVPLAFTFAALAARFPDSGGVATFATRAFGASVGGVTGWWYFISGGMGMTMVPLTAGYYLTSALGCGERWAPLGGAVILGIATVTNLAGVRTGARVQMLLAGGVATILAAVIAIAAPNIRPDAFVPFAPHGAGGIGHAAVLLVYAFSGWEAITHLSGEFRDVRRTLPIATLVTGAVVTVLYIGVAVAVVGTHAYGTRTLDQASLGVVVERGIGLSAAWAIAVAAFVICLGTTNAFTASLSRLGAALGRDGWAPRRLAEWSGKGVPTVSVLLVCAIGTAGLVTAAVFNTGVGPFVTVPSVLVLATYVVAMAAAVRVLRGWIRAVSGLALVMLLATVPFAGWPVVVPPVVALAVVLVRRVVTRRRRHTTAKGPDRAH